MDGHLCACALYCNHKRGHKGPHTYESIEDARREGIIAGLELALGIAMKEAISSPEVRGIRAEVERLKGGA